MQEYLFDAWRQQDIAVMLLDSQYVLKDYCLTAADIRNMLAAQASTDIRLDVNDAASIEQHVRKAPAGCCFSYQRQSVVEG